MKTIIAGSRNFKNYGALCEVMELFLEQNIPSVIISGGARGADQLGERWAKENGFPVDRYLPKWQEHGKAAGPIRNALMASKAEALVLFWDGMSRGSKNMLNEAEKRHLDVYTWEPSLPKDMQGG